MPSASSYDQDPAEDLLWWFQTLQTPCCDPNAPILDWDLFSAQHNMNSRSTSPSKRQRTDYLHTKPEELARRADEAVTEGEQHDEQGARDEEEHHDDYGGTPRPRHRIGRIVPFASSGLFRDDVFGIQDSRAADTETAPSLVHSASMPYSSRPAPTPSESSAGTRTTTTTTASRTSGKSTSSRRPKSPVKNLVDLRFFDKPVKYAQLDDAGLPPEIGELAELAKLVAHYGLNRRVLPLSIRDELEAAMSRLELTDSFFYPDTSQGREEALHTLGRLMEIKDASRESTEWDCSEAAWNLHVHYPVLGLALGNSGVRPELMCVSQSSRHPSLHFPADSLFR